MPLQRSMNGPVLGRFLAVALLVAGLGTPNPLAERHVSAAGCLLDGRPLEGDGVTEIIQDLLADRAEHYSLVLRGPAGASVGFQPDRVFYAASLYKLAVMYELFRQRDAGEVGFDEELLVTEEAAAEDLGTLEPLGIDVGDAVSVEHLLEFMITLSDNTSAVMLQQRLGSQNVDLTMQGLGLQSTSVMTPELPTTASDVALLLSAIAEGQGVSSEARQAMGGLLRRQTIRDGIPAGLPEEVAVGNKTGSWFDAAHDAAIVWAPFGTYILVALSDAPEEGATIADLSRLVYNWLTAACESQLGERQVYPTSLDVGAMGSFHRLLDAEPISERGG